MDRPVASFYCCYLLRSSIRPACFYVGSTPNPFRRQRQHNGESKGGAKRTRDFQKRPWHMCMIVSGFPSQISALQFEWAWQNTYKTRHVTRELRTRAAETCNPPDRRALAKKDDKGVKPPTKDQNSKRKLSGLMNDLNLLLTSKSFSRLSLSLRFFDSDAYNEWRKKRSLDSNISLSSVSFGPNVYFDSIANIATDRPPDEDINRCNGLEHLDTSYASSEPLILKSFSRLSGEKPLFCDICAKEILKTGNLLVTCRTESCEMVSHVACLAKHFLELETQETALMPKHGPCPVCQKILVWIDLMRDLSLRTRGQAKVDKLVKAKRRNPKPLGDAGNDCNTNQVSLLDDDTEDEDFINMNSLHGESAGETDAEDRVFGRVDEKGDRPISMKSRHCKSAAPRKKILPDGEDDSSFQIIPE